MVKKILLAFLLATTGQAEELEILGQKLDIEVIDRHEEGLPKSIKLANPAQFKLPNKSTLTVNGKLTLMKDGSILDAGEGKIELENQTLEIKSANFYHGENVVASAELAKPATFQLNELNSVNVEEYVWFHKNGAVELAANLGLITWNLKDGSKLALDCSKRDADQAKEVDRSRIAVFHDNGAYHGGCELQSGFEMGTANYFAMINPGSNIMLHKDESLKFASSITQQSAVRVVGQIVTVIDNSEIAVHENGRVRFFTMTPSDYVLVPTSNVGYLTALTNPEKRTAMVFDEMGRTLVAPLYDHVELKIDDTVYRIPVSGVVMLKDRFAASFLLPAGLELPDSIKERSIYNKAGERAVCVDKENTIRELDYCKQLFNPEQMNESN